MSGDLTGRLHPATIVAEVFKLAGRMAGIIAIVVITRLMGRDTPTLEILFGAFAAFQVVGAAIRVFTLRYGVVGGSLEIRSGVITRNQRTIPLDRVQNVQLRRSLIHRWLGIVEVQVETAAGSGAEAVLSALGTVEAAELKAALTGAPAVSLAADRAQAKRNLVYEASLSDLALAGSLSNRAGVILGSIFGLLYFFGGPDQFIPDPIWDAATQVGRADALIGPAILVGGGLLLLGVGWLLSIGATIVSLYGFSLESREDKLVRRYGLLTHDETLIPPHRVQISTIEEPWLFRLLGYARVQVDTAGSVVDTSENKQSQNNSVLCPMIATWQAPQILRLVFAWADVNAMEWRAVSRKAIRRGFFMFSWLVALIALPISITVSLWAWAGFVGLLPVLWLLARRRYRMMAYALDEHTLGWREGLFGRKLSVVPISKVQWVSLNQSPFQRRQGIASVRLSTAAAGGSGITLIDLPEEAAFEVARRLSEGAAARGAWLPDAV